MRVTLVVGMLLATYCGGGGEKPAELSSRQREDLTIAKSILMVIAPSDFRDEEFKEPYELFTNAGIKVVVASTDTTPVKGMLGMMVKPDVTFEQVNTKEFDALVIVGGTGCAELYDNEILHEIVQAFSAESKTISAICLAPMVLARARVLNDKIVTAHASVRDAIGKSCARCTDSDIEVSGNVVTCSRLSVASEFAETIMDMLGK